MLHGQSLACQRARSGGGGGGVASIQSSLELVLDIVELEKNISRVWIFFARRYQFLVTRYQVTRRHKPKTVILLR